MKSILIERLANGWIVRPFSSGPGWPMYDKGQMYVYRTVEHLMGDMPKLLEASVEDCQMPSTAPVTTDPSPNPNFSTGT